jgi:hypothetical protein
MPKNTSGFDPSQYSTVAERVALFRAAYPLGRIRTMLHSHIDGQVIFVAEVFRRPEDTEPAATGWASEREGDGEINVAACLENTETSAVGRALANLGFSASRHRASVEEMLAAARRTNRAALRLVREPSRADAEIPRPDAFTALQETANALADALGQLAQAERLGLPARQATRLRRALEGRFVPPSVIARAEQELRAWFDEHMPSPPQLEPGGTPGTTPQEEAP